MTGLPSSAEWDLTQMPDARRSILEADLSLSALAQRIAMEAVVQAPDPEDAYHSPVPMVRAIFAVHIKPETGDIFHNGCRGLRAYYWAAPELGDQATQAVIKEVRSKLLARIPAMLRTRGGVNMPKEMVVRALELAATRIWVAERELCRDGEQLRVERWERNEGECGNSRLWRWTPRASIVEVKTGWIASDGSTWIVERKKDRAMQIHRWGFS